MDYKEMMDKIVRLEAMLYYLEETVRFQAEELEATNKALLEARKKLYYDDMHNSAAWVRPKPIR
jgi:uncharacterized coiled-coil protein SlyX